MASGHSVESCYRRVGRPAAGEQPNAVSVADAQLLLLLGAEGQTLVDAVHVELESVRPAPRDLTDGQLTDHAAGGFEEDSGEVFGFHGPPFPGGNDRSQLRCQASNTVASDELRQIDPVDADVGECAGPAADVGCDPPVGGGRVGQPVLEVAAAQLGESALAADAS